MIRPNQRIAGPNCMFEDIGRAEAAPPREKRRSRRRHKHRAPPSRAPQNHMSNFYEQKFEKDLAAVDFRVRFVPQTRRCTARSQRQSRMPIFSSPARRNVGDTKQLKIEARKPHSCPPESGCLRGLHGLTALLLLKNTSCFENPGSPFLLAC